MLLGAAIAIQTFVVGLLFCGLALLIISGGEGLVIDFDKKKMRNFWSILGIRMGPWEELPELESIRIVAIGSNHKANKKGKQSSTKGRHEVRLQFKEFNDFILAYRGPLVKAQNKAQFLAHYLKLKIKRQA